MSTPCLCPRRTFAASPFCCSSSAGGLGTSACDSGGQGRKASKYSSAGGKQQGMPVAATGLLPDLGPLANHGAWFGTLLTKKAMSSPLCLGAQSLQNRGNHQTHDPPLGARAAAASIIY